MSHEATESETPPALDIYGEARWPSPLASVEHWRYLRCRGIELHLVLPPLQGAGPHPATWR